MTTRQENTPNVQYLIEGTMPDGAVVDRFTIEQVEVGRFVGTTDHPNYNTVQKHLHDLGRKTGLNYRIVQWGDVMDCTAWLQGASTESAVFGKG
jgi:hypothetical protein